MRFLSLPDNESASSCLQCKMISEVLESKRFLLCPPQKHLWVLGLQELLQRGAPLKAHQMEIQTSSLPRALVLVEDDCSSSTLFNFQSRRELKMKKLAVRRKSRQHIVCNMTQADKDQAWNACTVRVQCNAKLRLDRTAC